MCPTNRKAMMRKFIRKPFKGHTFYEWQIGPIVFQIKHRDNPHFNRVHIWRDQYWRL